MRTPYFHLKFSLNFFHTPYFHLNFHTPCFHLHFHIPLFFTERQVSKMAKIKWLFNFTRKFKKMKNPTSTVIRKIKKVNKFPLSISPNPEFLMSRNMYLAIFQTGFSNIFLKKRGAKNNHHSKKCPQWVQSIPRQ